VVENQTSEKVQQLEHELKKEKEEKQGLLASISELNQTQNKSKKKITQLEKKINQYQRDMKDLKQVPARVLCLAPRQGGGLLTPASMCSSTRA
jgi:predicted  nucleic acid-binding Zn-ribbon protein